MDSTRPLLTYIRKHIPLSESEAVLFLAKTRIRKYLKGQYVLQAGDVCNYESFVLSGCLKTSYVDDDGQEHIVFFAIEDWWAADLGSFVTRKPAKYNIQCLENTELAQLSHDDVEDLYRQIPQLERFFRIIIQKAYAATQQRLIDHFSMVARDQYLQFRERYPKIEQRVPQYMIASYLGITPEFLSKLRSKLISEQ